MANEIDYDDVFGQILGSVTEDDMPEVKEEKSVPELTQEDKDILKSYQDLMEKNEDKGIQFMGIARNGSLYSYQGNVRIVLPQSCMSAEYKQIMEQGMDERDKLLDKPCKVRVLGIKSENPKIPAVIMTMLPQISRMREAARKALNQMIVNKDTTRIKAKVVMVDMGRRRILLDIGGYGIKGVCNLSDWNGGGATTVLNMVDIKEGDVASVSVIGKYDNRKGSVLSNAYRCVRVQANPYAGIERKFPVGTTVRAMAMTCNQREGYVYMKIQGFDAAQILCWYPWKRNGGFQNMATNEAIICGCIYKVIITKASEKERKFRGRILERCPDKIDEEIARHAQRRAMMQKGEYVAEAYSDKNENKNEDEVKTN